MARQERVLAVELHEHIGRKSGQGIRSIHPLESGTITVEEAVRKIEEHPGVFYVAEGNHPFGQR